jgi:thiol-disulfide isomerase/thioredoxin
MKRTHQRNKNTHPLALALVGAGLVLIGLVAGVLLLDSDAASGSSGQGQGEPPTIPARVNYSAPELRLADLDGNPVSLEDYRGQVILVNNWATWCPPCKAEMPTLQEYYEDHQAQRFILVAIEAGDPASEVARFVADYRLTFPVWLDPKNLALRAFQNDSLPSSYVIDRIGTVRLAWTGAIGRTALDRYVTPLLEE